MEREDFVKHIRFYDLLPWKLYVRLQIKKPFVCTKWVVVFRGWYTGLNIHLFPLHLQFEWNFNNRFTEYMHHLECKRYTWRFLLTGHAINYEDEICMCYLCD